MSCWQDKPRVLIVDDDDEFMADLKVLLSPEFDVSTAMGTHRAHELLAQHRYDCLLLDLNMPQYFGNNPEFEGLSFLGHLRTDSSMAPALNMPVIILTAYADSSSLERAKKYGIATLYQKPPDIRLLTAAIWNVVSRTRGH
jgi:CheY-like chemotaxis protein